MSTRSPSHALLGGALFPLVCVVPLLIASPAATGPYVDVGHAAATMASWATAVETVTRGPQDIAAPSGPLASAGSPANVLGAATGAPADTLSLGDGGAITVYLASGISNGPGDDFAVFENGFFDLFGLFGELAFVEVASNGVDFAEFESHTLNALPVGPFDTLDPTDYDGLAGRHPALLGTGFDLADLAFDPLVQSGSVDLTDVRYVRMTDVVGDDSRSDSFGNALYDPYATPFVAGGFDLDAVGVIHVPEPEAAAALAVGLLALGATRRRRSTPRVVPPIAAALLLAGPALASTATFDDLGLGAESYENGAGLPGGGYTSGGVFFENTYFPSFDGFSGFAASTTTDATTPGFSNQFSNITGSGAGASAGFGIYFMGDNVVLPSEQVVLGAQITNTTYAALSMRDGDAFAKTFGGPTGNDEDFFRLIIEGLDDTGTSAGTVEFLLADYRFADNTLDYIVEEWTWLDLSGLGPVRELSFSFESSDVGAFGINTPQYFAIDDLVTIPEPGTALLLGLGLGGLARRRAQA